MAVYSTHRDEALNKSLDDGRARAIDIIKDSFGGEIPRELELVNPPEYEVEYQGMLTNPGYVASTMWDTIKTHWLSMGAFALFHQPLVSAGIFTASTILKGLSTKGYVDTSKPGYVVNINEAWSMARHFDKAHGGIADVIAHENAHLFQLHDHRKSLSSAFDDRTRLSLLFEDASGYVKYVSGEAEMQARLFTVISNAYVQHGILPTNKYELWACLESQGMEAPEEIKELARRNKDVKNAFAKFPRSGEYMAHYADKKGVGDLNEVQDNIDEAQGRFNLWNFVYPFIYGDLLEIMGDRQGHKRMGGGCNRQLREIFMKSAQDFMNGDIGPREVTQTMQKTAAMMPADDAMDLMHDIASGHAYVPMNKEAIFIPAGSLRVAASFALASHPEVKPHVASATLRDATGFDAMTWKNQMERRERMAQARNITPAGRHRQGPWGPVESKAFPFGGLSVA